MLPLMGIIIGLGSLIEWLIYIEVGLVVEFI